MFFLRLFPSYLLLFLFLLGCNRGPRAVKRPNINPKKISSRAIEILDSNADGKLSKDESASSPGLAVSFSKADVDNDNFLSASEISDRIQRIVKISPAVVGLSIELSQDAKPVKNALVRLIPEEFLGDAFAPAFGTTDDLGIATIRLATEDLPFEGAPNGLRPGLYHIEVELEDGKTVLPKQRGVDVSMDARTLRTATFKVQL